MQLETPNDQLHLVANVQCMAGTQTRSATATTPRLLHCARARSCVPSCARLDRPPASVRCPASLARTKRPPLAGLKRFARRLARAKQRRVRRGFSVWSKRAQQTQSLRWSPKRTGKRASEGRRKIQFLPHSSRPSRDFVPTQGRLERRRRLPNWRDDDYDGQRGGGGGKSWRGN